MNCILGWPLCLIVGSPTAPLFSQGGPSDTSADSGHPLPVVMTVSRHRYQRREVMMVTQRICGTIAVTLMLLLCKSLSFSIISSTSSPNPIRSPAATDGIVMGAGPQHAWQRCDGCLGPRKGDSYVACFTLNHGLGAVQIRTSL